MNVHVALLPELIPSNPSNGVIAVVIDTLRFTTTACQALAVGAASIVVESELEIARRHQSGGQSKTLLCGERHCVAIPGFDLGNSPYEYSADNVSGARLVFTTTNGTRAVKMASHASEVWLAAFVNRAATCEALRSREVEQLWLVCSGTDGEVALEDVLAAGAIVEGLQSLLNEQASESDPLSLNDSGHLALAAWNESKRGGPANEPLAVALRHCQGGSNLVEAGYGQDLVFAAQIDSLNVVATNRGQPPNRFQVN